MAIYKHGRGFELGTYQEQIQKAARAGLEPGTIGLRVRRADHSATPPPLSSPPPFKPFLMNPTIKRTPSYLATVFLYRVPIVNPRTIDF